MDNQVISPRPKHKVAFARRAGDAHTVGEATTIIPITQFIPGIQPTPNGSTQLASNGETLPTPKVGVFKPHGLPGRPPKDKKPELRLPRGFETLRSRGKNTYTKELGEAFVEAYYNAGGSFTRACRKCNVKFSAANEWKQDHPEFTTALNEVDQIIKDEVHSQFMERVLETWESNPAWKFKYFNKHFPEYSDTKKSVKITFDLKDTLIKPEVVEGEVIHPKQLAEENATGPEQPLDLPPNPSEVLQSNQRLQAQ
jgi:hypothetical protein